MTIRGGPNAARGWWWLWVAAIAGCSRGMAPATPQEGPLVGAWRYAGADVAPGRIVRLVVIGDRTWAVPAALVFAPDGTVNADGDAPCHYWIHGATSVQIDCGAGSGVLPYAVTGDALRLELRGDNTALLAGSSLLEYHRRD